jgi:hypothetical protein
VNLEEGGSFWSAGSSVPLSDRARVVKRKAAASRRTPYRRAWKQKAEIGKTEIKNEFLLFFEFPAFISAFQISASCF